METTRKLRLATMLVHGGYDPRLSEGALNPPTFNTSTWCFRTAEEGEAFFEVACGLREGTEYERRGLIYSRLNHPGAQIFEERLVLWDGAEECVSFPSGMAAILATCLAYLKPGDVILHTEPLYGGTDHFFKQTLAEYKIHAVAFTPGDDLSYAMSLGRMRMLFIETPANPTNMLHDIGHCVEIVRALSAFQHGARIPVVVDNTFLSPVGQHPLQHGADLVIYSATKHISGFSNHIAGACLGSREALMPIKAMRGAIAPISPYTASDLLLSLMTLEFRVKKQAENAGTIARYLAAHPKVARVHYLGLLEEGDPQYTIYKKQCLSPGSMISFDIRGGKNEAFRFLNALRIFCLAVSLGGVESLAEHPYRHTHAGIIPKEKEALGITDSTIRLSIGIEDSADLVYDLDNALACV